MNLIRDRWMFVPVAFLSITVTVAVTTVSVAVVGRPIGAEPEYYAKAAAWDDELAQRAANDRLRWAISPEIEPGPDGRPLLTLRINDKYSGVIDAESVTVEAIPIANADRRASIPMRRVGEGHFDAPLDARVPGQWEFRVRVVKGESVYTDTFRRTLRFATRSAGAGGDGA